MELERVDVTKTVDDADASAGPRLAATEAASPKPDAAAAPPSGWPMVEPGDTGTAPSAASLTPLVEHLVPFTGATPANLASSGVVRLGGAFSFMCTSRMDGIDSWSRVFDFSDNADEDSVTAGAIELTLDLHFTVFRGRKPFSVRVNDFFVLGQEFTMLCTVSATGHMKVYKDGVLVGENTEGMAPLPADRPRMIVGGHFLFHDQIFRGLLKDVMVWDQEVSWPAPAMAEASPPNEDSVDLVAKKEAPSPTEAVEGLADGPVAVAAAPDEDGAELPAKAEAPIEGGTDAESSFFEEEEGASPPMPEEVDTSELEVLESETEQPDPEPPLPEEGDEMEEEEIKKVEKSCLSTSDEGYERDEDLMWSENVSVASA